MNFKNSEEVIEAVQLFKLEPKVLDGNLSSFVLNNILRKFTNETKYNYPLWDKIEDSRAYK